jgi:cysteine desulfurase
MPIYLDHAATAPLRPGALSVMLDSLKQIGNPASVHAFGQRTRELLEEAREEIARELNADRNEVIFTSGGTESDNLAIKGLFWQRKSENPKRNLIISSAAEHHAVLDSIEWLVRDQAAEVHYLSHSSSGALDLNELSKLLGERADQVAFISIMWANNEIGIINPIAEIVEIAKEYQIPVHSDAIAALGHMPVSFKDSGLSAMSITGHKIGGPVGIGALLLRRDQKLTPLLHGGGHERGIRSGTPDASGAKAFAYAISESLRELEEMTKIHRNFSNRIIDEVRHQIPDVVVTGEGLERLPNNVHFRFPGCLGDSLLFLLDMSGVSVSTGSACTAGVAGP